MGFGMLAGSREIVCRCVEIYIGRSTDHHELYLFFNFLLRSVLYKRLIHHECMILRYIFILNKLFLHVINTPSNFIVSYISAPILMGYIMILCLFGPSASL